ncbi:MAG: hypothetical protein CFE21_13560 [Bacteroidetes bacterium B1(2017)]|nr:MAG: hypothetical protein CFE21_13560 [Bacteroidetes bacterium B1(2017)]
MPVKETMLDILHLHIMEPTTVFTNLIMGGLCFVFFNRLKKEPVHYKLGSNWKFFFLFMGIASIIGALTHGLKSYFGQDDYYFVWLLMNLAGIPCSYFLLQANIELSKLNQELKKKLKLTSIVLTAILTILVIMLNNFLLVKLNAGFVIGLTLFNHFKTYRSGFIGSGFILLGFTISTSSLLVHGLKISYSEWFNYKDISHVIMSISLYIIFLGVMEKMKLAGLETEKAR